MQHRGICRILPEFYSQSNRRVSIICVCISLFFFLFARLYDSLVSFFRENDVFGSTSMTSPRWHCRHRHRCQNKQVVLC